MNQFAVTAQEMRSMEQAAFDYGVPPVLVMENAARALCGEIESMLSGARDKRVLFLCGPGNNGGDGLACARLFAQRGGKSCVYLPVAPKTPSARDNEQYARYLGIPVLFELPSPAQFDLCVDALLGIGQTRAPEGKIALAAEWINQAGLPVVSVDVPTGMDGDTGHVFDPCVRADVTVTFHAAKLGLLLTDRRESVGDLRIAPIGIHACDRGIPYYPMDALDALLPPRDQNAHKGSCGRVLVYAGSLGKAGAAAMCALGALKAGAGLVTVACPETIIPTLQALIPNAMCVPLDKADTVAFDVLAAGCGIGTDENARLQLIKLLQKADSCVLDADALNIISQDITLLENLRSEAVLTPHPGEMARLCGKSVDYIQHHRIEVATEFAQRYGVTLLLKGCATVIAAPDGRIAFNTSGSPAMAKGGMGDVLAGVISSLAAQGYPLFESAVCGAYIHGLAGEKGEVLFSQYGLTPEDMPRLICEVIKEKTVHNLV